MIINTKKYLIKDITDISQEEIDNIRQKIYKQHCNAKGVRIDHSKAYHNQISLNYDMDKDEYFIAGTNATNLNYDENQYNTILINYINRKGTNFYQAVHCYMDFLNLRDEDIISYIKKARENFMPRYYENKLVIHNQHYEVLYQWLYSRKITLNDFLTNVNKDDLKRKYKFGKFEYIVPKVSTNFERNKTANKVDEKVYEYFKTNNIKLIKSQYDLDTLLYLNKLDNVSVIKNIDSLSYDDAVKVISKYKNSYKITESIIFMKKLIDISETSTDFINQDVIYKFLNTFEYKELIVNLDSFLITALKKYHIAIIYKAIKENINKVSFHFNDKEMLKFKKLLAYINYYHKNYAIINNEEFEYFKSKLPIDYNIKLPFEIVYDLLNTIDEAIKLQERRENND